jgi:hypothetical protein
VFGLFLFLEAGKICPADEPAVFDYGIEPMCYLENDRVRVGIDLSIGGAVTYLSDKKNGGENMINSADWGRQIQLSYYSGPIPFIGPNGEKPTERWAGLGWNPIQSGDVGGNRSKAIAFSYPEKHSMLVRCIPMQWPHSGVPGDCEFQCLYTLKDNVLQLKATITNHRTDKTQYDARQQEMPALYTNGAWYKLVSYLGGNPFENEPVTVIVDKNDGKGWPWVNFCTPEHWSALIDEHGMGIGVYQPDAVRVTAGFHGGDANKGHGGAKSGQTGYIAPLTRQILDHNIAWTYETFFILGTIDEVRNFAKQAERGKDSPVWEFHETRNGWFYEGGAKDFGLPTTDSLDITFPENGKLTGPDTYWKAGEKQILEIEGAFTTEEQKEMALIAEIQPYAPADFTDWLGWSEGVHDVAKEKAQKAEKYPSVPSLKVEIPVLGDGTERVYRVNLSTVSGYKGAIKNLSFRFTKSGKAKIKQIRILKTESGTPTQSD